MTVRLNSAITSIVQQFPKVPPPLAPRSDYAGIQSMEAGPQAEAIYFLANPEVTSKTPDVQRALIRHLASKLIPFPNKMIVQRQALEVAELEGLKIRAAEVLENIERFAFFVSHLKGSSTSQKKPGFPNDKAKQIASMWVDDLKFLVGDESKPISSKDGLVEFIERFDTYMNQNHSQGIKNMERTKKLVVQTVDTLDRKEHAQALLLAKWVFNIHADIEDTGVQGLYNGGLSLHDKMCGSYDFW